MAMLISRATGNLTSSGTWGVADSATGSQLTNPLAESATPTSAYSYSSTFTGTNGAVCDGIVLFLRRNGTSGTVSVALSDDNGVTATRSVTVNAADLPADQSWVFFKFGSTLTLDGGTDYRVGVLSNSGGSGATVGRDGTANNWARIISTTTTAAPAAGDTMLVVGELTGAGTSNAFTVTMDSTANTDYGTGVATATAPVQFNTQAFTGLQIGVGGTLTWGTSAATNYILRLSGNLVVWSGGTYNMGTTGTPCPRDSTMTLEFDCAADGDHGFLGMNGSTVNLQGQSRSSGKNVIQTLLSSDAAASATTLNVVADTGWKSGDRIALSSTAVHSQHETRTLASDAGTSSLVVSSGITNARNVTASRECAVILLTHNVKVRAVTAGLATFFAAGNTATFDLDWVEFRYMGVNTVGKRGVTAQTTTGSFTADFCSVSDSDSSYGVSFVLEGTSLNNISIDDCVSYSLGSFNVTSATSGTNWNMTNCTAIAAGDGFIFNDLGGTISNCRSASNTRYGFLYNEANNSLAHTTTNCKAHNNSATGFQANTANMQITFDTCSAWGNGLPGFAFDSSARMETTFINCTSYANGDGGFTLAGDVTMINPVAHGMTWGGQSQALNIQASCRLRAYNADFGTATGNNVAHTNGDIRMNNNRGVIDFVFYNSKFSSATEVSNQTFISSNSPGVSSDKHDQVSGAYKTWRKNGTIERDTTISNSAAPSERMTPNSATLKLAGGSRLVPVDSGATKTISVYVRKSATGSGDAASYNGAEPRLMLRRNDANGITSDTVLDTMTASGGTWEQLSGTTPAAAEDTAFEVYVDCDGTAGWINVDDWSVS